MRRIRASFHAALTLAGMLVVLHAVFIVEETGQRLLFAALGVVLMEAGVWRITQSVFPDERAYRPLRQETDYFIRLVRRLNRSAVAARRGSPSAAEELEQVYAEMIHSVERMRQLAGRTEAELGYAYRPVAERSRLRDRLLGASRE
jgi:hypothetical protein